MERDPPNGGHGGGDEQAWMARAFATARARMSAVPAAVTGYRLFWVREGAVGWKDLQAGGPYAILGSHEKCDVVLTDPGVSHRHVLATTIDLSDGPAVRLLDLNTEMPFCLQDGSPQRSIVGGGSVLARLGWTVFGAVPIDAGRAPEAPVQAPAAAPELPEMVKSESVRVPRSVKPEPSSPSPPGTPQRPPARVTVMPRSWQVSDLPPRAALPTRPGLLPTPPPPPAAPAAPRPAPLARSAIREVVPPGGSRSWPITLEREGRAASVTLTEDELGLGVVIGRAPNCHDGGLRAVLDMGVSRGHLLLLHHNDVIEAYDLCSLNGTWEGRRQVRRRPLGDEPVALTLSNHQPVTLHWHGRG